MNYQVHTFGCKVNTYDTGLIQKNMNAAKLAGAAQDLNSHIHILNTCAVTAEATKEAIRVIRRIKAKDPLSTVVVTGCGAQVDTGKFEEITGADLIIANSHKGLLPQILDQYFKGKVENKVFKSNIFRKEDLEMGGGEETSHTRSFLKIQDGCNSFCSYCIIPYARGKSRSIPVQEIANRVNDLYQQGLHEVVLTGVHIGDYDDNGKRLEDLVEALLLKTKMPRFRLSSLEPVEVSDRLLALYENPRMCQHFHMSIQSAETNTLKLMKRNYGQAEVTTALQKIRNKFPYSFIGMDVIVGFPSETEEQFEETFRNLAELPWTRIHVFPYSERSGTKAAVMPETVPQHERVKRAQKLRELSLHRYQSEALLQNGELKQVLVLKKAAKGGAQALSKDYWPVKITNRTPVELELFSGKEIEVKIKGYEHNPQQMEGVLLAEVVVSV